MNIHSANFSRSVIITMLIALVLVAQASRMYLPMGHCIREAETIVIADTRKGNAWETILSVREVIKGDAALAGQTFTLKRGGPFSTADAYVPANTEGIGILLRAGWKDAKDWPVLEAYRKPEEIQALRILASVCAIDNERERLLALRGTLANSNRVCEEELFAQLRDMRSPANFDILTNLYPALESTNQAKLVDLIGDMGDLRGVPALISAAASPDQKISRIAVDKLRLNFPGAPGVTTALEDALRREHLTRVAAIYLARYQSDPKLAALAEGKGTPWLRAMRLLDSGKRDEGRAAFLEIVKDDSERFRMRLNSASWLIKEATAEKNQIRQALLPLLARERYADDYLLALEVAELLRGLRHPDCLDALLPILRQTPFTSTKATWTATMAIRELGEVAREKAFAQIQVQLNSPPPKAVLAENPLRYPLELIWLGSQKNFEEAGPLMHAEYAESWKSLRPLQALGNARDESRFLIQQLSQRSSLPGEATEWILLRLGDLKDKRAIRELVACFVGEPNWRLGQGAADALVTIGGHEVEEELTKLLRHEDENRVRRHATEALFTLLGDNSRDLSRRVLTEKDFGWKPAAYLALSRVGTADDLKLLLPLADYWTGDRANHYWAMTALQSVRDRCNYDVNGPIKTGP